MPDLQDDKARARGTVEAAFDDLRGLSHDMVANPELALEEDRAHDRLSTALERYGYDVTRHAFDLPTAFRATVGDSGPHVVVCAEYDALPGIGHACGHNVIGAAAIGAGVALRPFVDELGFRLTVLGTPAEEAVGGKALMVQRGALEDADLAVMVHPAPLDMLTPPMLALEGRLVTVKGRASHASVTHTRKGNALDGIVETYRMLAHRECGPWERCHGVISHGGAVPNVVPEEAQATYYFRSRTADELGAFSEQLEDEIRDIVAEQGCSVEFDTWGELYREMKQNHSLADVYRENAERLGRQFVPRAFIGPESAASTDMGNVSQVVPSIHPMIGIDSLPHINHQRGFTEAAASPKGDAAIVDGATAMAWTVLDVVTGDGVLDAITREFAATDSVGDTPGDD